MILTAVPVLVALQSHFAEDAIVAPTTSAATRATEALTGDPSAARPLPVWPPPKPVDPAANGMIGAPPQRVDWPADLPKGDAGAH
ncbi:MAG TPA: hypothetical protein VF407_01715 [Polyangiaceae bacterium]